MYNCGQHPNTSPLLLWSKKRLFRISSFRSHVCLFLQVLPVDPACDLRHPLTVLWMVSSAKYTRLTSMRMHGGTSVWRSRRVNSIRLYRRPAMCRGLIQCRRRGGQARHKLHSGRVIHRLMGWAERRRPCIKVAKRKEVKDDQGDATPHIKTKWIV